MRLTNLIASSEGVRLHGDDRDITGLTADSRKVQPGFLFAAIPGEAHDGRDFIPEAAKRGAAAILAPKESPPAMGVKGSYTLITAPDVRKTISAIAASFYPLQPENIAAVTGTSGKTSTAQFAREIWQALGHKSASIGTLGLVTAQEARYGSLTTPDAITLHKLLDEIARGSVTHLAIEASSHGLSMHRLDHVDLKAAAFTNLSHDHLDFHETMENYLNAKLRLFAEVLPEGAVAVLNADAPAFEKIAGIAKGRGQTIISYGRKGSDLKLIETRPDAKGQILSFELAGKKMEVTLPVIGDFQACNALCALGLSIGIGENAERAARALAKISGVRGRLELAGTKDGASVFVDYAHKPDALENVLTALRPHVRAHKGATLGLVFGCGGDRDKAKRPMMGAIARRLADWVIVTDDNPRHEDAASIRKEILAGGDGDVREIGDRTQAITAGIERLKKGDVLIIAGKGHETGQIIGDTTLPFDDADVARRILKS